MRRITGCFGGVVLLMASLMGGGREVPAQNLGVPGDMPTLYEEDPYNPVMRRLARHRVKLRNCTIGYRGVINGYYLKSGHREFVILNQNPKCLAGLENQGKIVTVEGRTTESLTPYYDIYYLVIHQIDGRGYQGRVGPCVPREPTTAEIRYWQQYRRLPPGTQKFMDYLALPQQGSELQVAVGRAAGSGAPEVRCGYF